MQVDQDALTFVFPFFGVGTIASCASSMVVNFSVVRSIYMVRKLLEDHHFGRQGTAAWASVSPKLRNALQDCCSSPNIIKMAKVSCLLYSLTALLPLPSLHVVLRHTATQTEAVTIPQLNHTCSVCCNENQLEVLPATAEMACAQDAMRQAITGAFQQPSPAADHLCISRFTALLAKLTVPVLSAVMHEEHEEHGKYMDTVLQHLMLQWHLPGGPAQVSTSCPS